MAEPRPKTIRQVVEYLESIGLSVYGSWTDLATGSYGPGCMDYDADAVLAYRKLHRADKLHRDDQND